MIERVGITGPRTGINSFQRQSLWDVLYGKKEVHHGDCIGADAMAHIVASGVGVDRIVIHPPIKPVTRAFCMPINDVTEVIWRPQKEYIARDHDIVEETECLVGLPNRPEYLRSGTWATIRYARKQQKPIYLIWPDHAEWEE